MSNFFTNFYFILLILYSCISKSNSIHIFENKLQKPIMKLALNGLNLGEIEKILITKLLSNKIFTLPNINITQNVTFIGNMNLSLNNMILTIFNNTEADFSFNQEDNINININPLKGKINFNYLFTSNFISSEGNGTIFLNNINLQINNTLYQIKNAHETEKEIPGIKIDSIGINKFELDFSFSKNGTFEKLIKYFYKNLKQFLLNVMKIELNKLEAIKSMNDKLYNIFTNINLNIPLSIKNIEENLKLSFSIDEKPIIKNNYLEISIKAEIIGNYYIYDEINNITLPCIVDNPEFISNKSINTFISQFIFNNAIDVYYYFGKLNIEITNNTLGISEISVGLLSGFIKEITNGYKSNQTAKIITKALASPLLEINSNDTIKLTLNENIKIFVYNETKPLNENNGTIPIDADSLLEINMNFIINNEILELKLNSIQMLSFEIINSLVGDVDVENAKKNFNNLVKLYLSQINKKIKEKVENFRQALINYKGINFTNIFGKSYENYIKVDISPILISLFNLIYYQNLLK